MTAAPMFRPVGAEGLLIEFGTVVDDELNDRVLALDAAIAVAPPPGFREAVPAFASLLVMFEPLAADHAAVEAHLRPLIDGPSAAVAVAAEHTVPVCYSAAFAPDLAAVAERTGLAPEMIAHLHQGARYRVHMYGFAPGFAYLGGVPAPLQLPRKPRAVAAVAPGSVLIAGAQCLAFPLAMPSGWWAIGRSPARLFDAAAERPFPWRPGDSVRFVAVGPEALG